MFLITNTSLLHLTAIKSKRQRLEWIIESSHDAREGDFIAVWFCRRFFFFFTSRTLFLSWLQMVALSKKKTEVKQREGAWTSPALSAQTKQVLWGSAYGQWLLIQETCWSGLLQNVCFLWQQLVLRCFVVFLPLFPPAAYISWFDLKRSSACFTFPFFANAPNTSASTRTLRSHLPVCIGPFGVTRSHHRCVLTEKPPWQLQSRARKEKKQV